jgi:hypothetical protein
MGRSVLIFVLLAAGPAVAGPKKKVQIETNPTGASVYINDVELGEICKTPCPVNVDEDATLIIALEGHKPEVVQVAIGRRERAPYKRKFDLVAAIGKIIVEGPRGADIEIDDKNRGKAPREIDVSAGTHSVVLTLDGRQVFADAVEVAANEEVPIKGKTSVAVKEPPDGDPPDGDPPDGDPPDGDPPDGGDITRPLKPEPTRGDRIFSASAAVSVGFRDFKYNGVANGADNLNPSNEKGQIVVGPVVELWPGTALGVRALRGLSILARAQFGVNPQEVLDEDKMPIGATTFWRTFEGSVRQRFTLGGKATIEGSVGYLRDQQRFEGDASQVPDADYTSLRLSLRASALLGNYEPYLSFDNLVVLTGAGQVAENFPVGASSVQGLKVAGGVAANFGSIAARVEASHTRYTWTFRMGDATGATDAITYVSFVVGYAY